MEKDRNTALLLCIFLGFFGAHKFYEGKFGMGILYIFTGGLFCIGWIYDIIVIASKPEKYYLEKKEKEHKELRTPTQSKEKKKLHCPVCGGGNISVQLDVITESYGSKTELRKKSPITNAGNSIWRAGMILMTGGLWALTPKKSKYNEIQNGNIKTKKIKTAICQECGKSWRIFGF